MRILLLCSLIYFSFSSKSSPSDRGDFSLWLEKLPSNPSMATSLNLYFTNQFQNNSKSEYLDTLFSYFKNDLLDNLDLSNLETCDPLLKLDFDSSLTQSPKKEERNFESNLLRIQSIDCLPNLEIKKVVGTYLDDSFQTKHIYGLVESRSSASKKSVCQKTSIFPFGKSEYCYENHIWKKDNTFVIVSLTTSTNPENSAPVYFRAVASAFSLLSSGQVKMSTLTYARGPELPMHGMVKNIAIKQHKIYIQGLINTASSY